MTNLLLCFLCFCNYILLNHLEYLLPRNTCNHGMPIGLSNCTLLRRASVDRIMVPEHHGIQLILNLQSVKTKVCLIFIIKTFLLLIQIQSISKIFSVFVKCTYSCYKKHISELNYYAAGYFKKYSYLHMFDVQKSKI